jgi:hypothetical protein
VESSIKFKCFWDEIVDEVKSYDEGLIKMDQRRSDVSGSNG